MRCRLLYMRPLERQTLGVFLYQVFEVEKIQVYTNGWKYPRESKQIHCINPKTKRKIMFYWYEVELLPEDISLANKINH